MPTAWAGERVTRSWQRNTREGEVTLDTEATTVEAMPDPGWPYYHPHEEWPARPYHGGTPYVMAPASPATQAIATAHVPDGPTRLDIPGSHYSKPGQKYRPGDNWFINSGLNLPNGVIETPEPEPDRTSQERTWTEWGEQMLNDGIDAFANLTWEDFWESMKLTCPPLGMIEDGINHFSTVYTNMQSNEGANHSVLFSSAVAGGSVLARWTGVENLSYFWESTDPVTGEEYNRWQRFGYGLLGTGQLFVSAFGIQQFGKMAVQNAVGMWKNVKTPCFTAGTQIVVGMGYDEDGNVLYDTKNIEEIQVGDLVYSYDTVNGVASLKEVTATYVRQSGHIDYLTFVDESGNVQALETTDSHPFWVVTDEPDLSRAARSIINEDGVWLYHEGTDATEHGFWVEAKDLRVGDVVLSADGRLSTLTNAVRVEQTGGIAVFNFEVAGNHNYFVLAKDFELGQSCVLVHNAVGYRAVSEAELADITATGKFRAGQNSMSGKWFATTKEGAEGFLKALQKYPNPPTTIVRAHIPDGIIEKVFKNHDNIAHAFYIVPEKLDLIKPILTAIE